MFSLAVTVNVAGESKPAQCLNVLTTVEIRLYPVSVVAARPGSPGCEYPCESAEDDDAPHLSGIDEVRR